MHRGIGGTAASAGKMNDQRTWHAAKIFPLVLAAFRNVNCSSAMEKR